MMELLRPSLEEAFVIQNQQVPSLCVLTSIESFHLSVFSSNITSLSLWTHLGVMFSSPPFIFLCTIGFSLLHFEWNCSPCILYKNWGFQFSVLANFHMHRSTHLFHVLILWQFFVAKDMVLVLNLYFWLWDFLIRLCISAGCTRLYWEAWSYCWCN